MMHGVAKVGEFSFRVAESRSVVSLLMTSASRSVGLFEHVGFDESSARGSRSLVVFVLDDRVAIIRITGIISYVVVFCCQIASV